MVMPKNILTHISKQITVLTVLTMGIIYPFMSGEYDRLAMPLSTIIQGFGIIGIILSLFGLIWLLMTSKYKIFSIISIYFLWFQIVVYTFFAYLISGILFAIVVLLVLGLPLLQHRQRMKKPTEMEIMTFFPIYLIVLPLSILTIQLLIAKPITDWSRDRTISNAKVYIRDIENFYTRNGYYPKTLQAMYKDYYPNTVGVEKFHYLPFGNSYNLSFEQPRFFLDKIGTKEWVVYNPKDAHRVYSHTSWFLLLSPQESEIRQGWYSYADTKHKHWKTFYFD
jgi:energy-converting hydrogenase Eha subunit A